MRKFNVDFTFPGEDELGTGSGALAGIRREERRCGGRDLLYDFVYFVRRVAGARADTVTYQIFANGEATHEITVPVCTAWGAVLDWAHTEIYRDGQTAAEREADHVPA